MKTYTVKQIAEMLNTNPETVRRWIRSGKLKAEQPSRKQGNVITEQTLEAFVKSVPRYSGIAASTAVISGAFAPIGIVAATAALLGGLAVQQKAASKAIETAQISQENLVSLLEQNIASRNEIIRRKEEAISQLRQEIALEQQNIAASKNLIQQICEQESFTKPTDFEGSNT